MPTKTILLCYDYFTPAYKAGGPIQSLANLVSTLNGDYNFKVITSAYDKGEKTPLKNIQTDKWIHSQGAGIYYWGGSLRKLFSVVKEYRSNKYAIIYINGIYSPVFNILPLLFSKTKIVLAPRGMLHDGALSQKSIKKKVYLFFFKLFRWHRKVVFHATDNKEKEFIQQQFSGNVTVLVAPNIPKNIGLLPILSKIPGELTLVSIALISPMKNIHLVLLSLLNIVGKVIYNIYGPVINTEYWNECLTIIKKLPGNIQVTYHGGLPPARVGEVLASNHVFILPSVSENFGHAIFESFSAGKPVITSNNTPWKNLADLKAGWNTETTIENLTAIIKKVISLDENEYSAFCKGAKQLADDYLRNAHFSTAYKKLFA